MRHSVGGLRFLLQYFAVQVMLVAAQQTVLDRESFCFEMEVSSVVVLPSGLWVVGPKHEQTALVNPLVSSVKAG